MSPNILLTTPYKLCKCEQCYNASKEKYNTFNHMHTTTHVLNVIYESGSLYKTKGKNNNIINYYFKQLYNTMQNKIHTAICMYKYKTIPSLVPHLQRITLFSWPTRRRVFTMMSNPASSMFIQNATSSLHMSTNSKPFLPRIL